MSVGGSEVFSVCRVFLLGLELANLNRQADIIALLASPLLAIRETPSIPLPPSLLPLGVRTESGRLFACIKAGSGSVSLLQLRLRHLTTPLSHYCIRQTCPPHLSTFLRACLAILDHLSI